MSCPVPKLRTERAGNAECVHTVALKEAALNSCVLSPRNTLVSNLVPTKERGEFIMLGQHLKKRNEVRI